MGPPPLSWHARARRGSHGEMDTALCPTPDGLMSRGGQAGSRLRSRDPSSLLGSCREVLKYLPARWPTECQVVSEPFPHLLENPSERERYYTVTGDELTPTPVSPEMGQVVFQYKPDVITRAFSKSCPERVESAVAADDESQPELEGVLQFESRFESGNLQQAVHVSGNYYQLRMRNDLFTERHTQWFYFRVTNMRAGVLYRFSVTNFARCSSLFTCGQKLLMYSVGAAQRTGAGWRRAGSEIAYYPCQVTRRSGEDQERAELSYVLSFTLEFPYDNDTVFLASGLPYTFSALQDHLRQMQGDTFISSICHQRVLCRSLAGNPIYLLTITAPDAPATKSRRAVVLTARVHPGETQASWMMRGVLNFLTSQSRTAELLRQRFVFKIVPMLNPDGVIVGNSRCSLAGRDVNRQFKHTHRHLYPAVWHLKLLVRRLMEETGVTVYCDFHGHSRRQNAFIYGCENRRNSTRYLTEKVFPFLLDKMARNLFDFDSCQFTVQKSKEGTGRVVMWAMGITNAYTLEASSAGSSQRSRANTHYRAHDYELIGQRFCETLLEFVDTSPLKERVRERAMTTLKEQYGYAEPTEGTESSSADDSDEEGPVSKTKKAGKKWQNKKLQSLMSWKKRDKTPQTLTRITLRSPSESSRQPSPIRSPQAGQETTAGKTAASCELSAGLPRSPGRSPSHCSRPGSARFFTGVRAVQTCPAGPRLTVPPLARPRSHSLEPDNPERCPPDAVDRLAAGTQRLSLRLPPPRSLASGHGALPNSPATTPSVVTSQAGEAQRSASLGLNAPSEAIVRRKKTKGKKVRKVKMRSKVSK
ncbi:cytosolic carboxypeptidase 2-like [Pollicipes pollicipes]|uniref:cytosolic carboxypeptidase 2-like n=1 Tax=Pollicipes pollicipes TaxID=41117 RepID=UPI0018856107|nr:cytosolic carboxypeptidase 2-like [Pollicipes pollicipes]